MPKLPTKKVSIKTPEVKSRQITLTVPDLKQTWFMFKHWFLLILLLAGAFAGGMYYQYHRYQTWNENIERQLAGKLTEKEKQLLAAKEDINQLESRIKTNSQLLADARRDRDFKMKELEAFRKKYNLEVDSLTKIIADLKGSTDQGTHTIDTANGVTSFKWHDEYNRFRLTVPDIAKPYSHFEYDQHFKLNLIVFRQKKPDGALRVQTAHLYELAPDGTVINEADIDLKKSTFEFAIEDQQAPGPAHTWLVNLSNKGEVLVSWMPLNKYNGMFGAGISAGMNARGDKFIGFSAMFFPPKWYKSSFGFGVSVGYDPNDRHVAYRAQVAWSFSDLIKGK